MQRKAIQFTANLESSLVRFTTHDNREYLVAPCIALVPGVLNGDLVTLEAVSSTYQAWNGRPVVLNHPYDDNGVSISANSPFVLANIGLGHLWNADVDENRLRVEVWLDVAKCQKLGGDAQRVVNKVETGSPLEVSTGYWATMRAKRGVYNEREYNETVELIIPDHLAMLPNAVGACNWADGCGIPRTNQGKMAMDERRLVRVITDAIKKLIPNMTVRDQFQALSALIGQEMEADGVEPYRWHMVDIEGEYAVIGMDNLFKRRQFSMMDDGNVAFTGEWETVHQQTTFVPVANEGICEACAGIHIQADEEKPDASSEEPESEAEPVENPESGADADKADGDNHETEGGEMTEVTAQQEDSLQVFLNEHRISKETLVEAIGMRNARREEWQTVVKANAALSDADMIGMTDRALEQLAKSYSQAEKTETVVNAEQPGTFVGRGMPASQGESGASVEPLRRPQVLVNKRDQKAG